MKKKYRVLIELYGVSFPVKYGTNIDKLSERARERIISYQKDVSRGSDGIFIIQSHEGRRSSPGMASYVKWSTVKKETVPYEVQSV